LQEDYDIDTCLDKTLELHSRNSHLGSLLNYWGFTMLPINLQCMFVKDMAFGYIVSVCLHC